MKKMKIFIVIAYIAFLISSCSYGIEFEGKIFYMENGLIYPIKAADVKLFIILNGEVFSKHEVKSLEDGKYNVFCITSGPFKDKPKHIEYMKKLYKDSYIEVDAKGFENKKLYFVKEPEKYLKYRRLKASYILDIELDKIKEQK